MWKRTLRALTFQRHCLFFRVFLPLSVLCVLEQTQMMGWCCSAVCKALAVLALLLPLRERSCWGLNPSSGDLDKSPNSDPDPWEVLQRHKRSWVWNQFFVLEEYTGNEPLYVGKVSVLLIDELKLKIHFGQPLPYLVYNVKLVWRGIMCLFIHFDVERLAQHDKLIFFTVTAALYLRVSRRSR